MDFFQVYRVIQRYKRDLQGELYTVYIYIYMNKELRKEKGTGKEKRTGEKLKGEEKKRR